MRYAIIAVFLITTLPTSLFQLATNIGVGQVAVSSQKLQLMAFLARYGSYDDTVLEIPSIPTLGTEDLESWFWHESNVIIPAVGLKRLYLSNEVVIYPYEERFDRYKIFAWFDDGKRACEGANYRVDRCEILYGRFIDQLRKENIKLVYVPSIITMPKNSQLKLLTQNETASVYEVLPL